MIALVLVYLTKLRATMSLLQNAPIGMFLVADTHKLHVYCGWTIFIDGTLHSCLHTTRWINQGNGELLWTHFSGISGIIIFTSLLLVSIPMMFQSLRRKMKYEIRKNTHYLFLAFALGLCFHSKAKGIPNGGFSPYVFGILLVWFFLDSFYCHFFMSEKIDTTQFTVLPNGVQIKMKVSDAFQNRVEGGYCYICLPWIAKTQW